MEPRLDHPAPHRRLAPALAGAHQGDGLALVGERLVGGHAVAARESPRPVEPALPFEGVHGPFGAFDRHGAGPPGERGGDQVAARSETCATAQSTARDAGSPACGPFSPCAAARTPRPVSPPAPVTARPRRWSRDRERRWRWRREAEAARSGRACRSRRGTRRSRGSGRTASGAGAISAPAGTVSLGGWPGRCAKRRGPRRVTDHG